MYIYIFVVLERFYGLFLRHQLFLLEMLGFNNKTLADTMYHCPDKNET